MCAGLLGGQDIGDDRRRGLGRGDGEGEKKEREIFHKQFNLVFLPADYGMPHMVGKVRLLKRTWSGASQFFVSH